MVPCAGRGVCSRVTAHRCAVSSLSNYIYYTEIVAMIKDLGQYEKFRSKLRAAAYEAMKDDLNGVEK